MKIGWLAVLLVSVAAFAACGSSDENTTDQTKALQSAMLTLGFDPNLLPPVLNDLYDCDIPVRIQPSPPATPVTTIKGQCKWTIVVRGTGWRIEFGEKWPCADWSIEVSPWKPCQVPVGSHSWTLQVNLIQGNALRLGEVGTFAPDMPR